MCNTISYLGNVNHNVGFSGGSAGKEFACNAGDLGWIPGLGRSPGEGKATFWPGEFHGQRSLAGNSPWGCKEADMTERLLLHHGLTGSSCLGPEHTWRSAEQW